MDLRIEPALEEIRPNRDEARLTLQWAGEDAAGEMVHWNLSLDLPRPGRFFSTDFPWIEGKKLLEIDFFSPGKEVAWNVLFPIRGRYELTVKADVAGKNPIESRFPLVVHEDSRRLFFLGLFVAGLFFLGALIGWAFSRNRAAVGLALFLLAGVGAEAAMETGQARVGELTPIRFTPTDDGESRVSFSIVRSEDRKRLFHIEGVTVSGSVAWRYQFFDGSPHRLLASVHPDGGDSPSNLEKEIHVEAREPPRRTVFMTFVFFLLPLAAGWPAGTWMRRVQKKL